MRLSPAWKSTLSGAAAGLLNGFFGVGGGMLLVPLFRRWLKLEDKRALATTIAVLTPLCLLSAGVYLWRDRMEWAVLWPYLTGGLIGGFLGGVFFRKIPALLLRRLFALLLLYGAARNLLS